MISSTPLRDFMKQIVRAPLLDQLRKHLGGLVQRRPAHTQLLVEQRRVPHRHPSRRLRRRVAVDELKVVESGEPLGEFNRVGDRGAGQQKARLGAVDRGDSPQPPQHVANVRAEHAAVDVRFVDDHEREVREQVAPRGVVRKDPDVEHVRVGDHQVAALADRGPLGARRVAVVDRGADRLVQPEPVQRAGLVLGERLGRIQIERARPRI